MVKWLIGQQKRSTFLRNFWNGEQGQDLIEYTLLMAFVALASAALFLVRAAFRYLDHQQ